MIYRNQKNLSFLLASLGFALVQLCTNPAPSSAEEQSFEDFGLIVDTLPLMLLDDTVGSKPPKSVGFKSSLNSGNLLSKTPSKVTPADIGVRERNVILENGLATLLRFRAAVQGGYTSRGSNLSIERRGKDLLVRARGTINTNGEDILVELANGARYLVRIRKAGDGEQAPAIVRITP